MARTSEHSRGSQGADGSVVSQEAQVPVMLRIKGTPKESGIRETAWSTAGRISMMGMPLS